MFLMTQEKCQQKTKWTASERIYTIIDLNNNEWKMVEFIIRTLLSVSHRSKPTWIYIATNKWLYKFLLYFQLNCIGLRHSVHLSHEWWLSEMVGRAHYKILEKWYTHQVSNSHPLSQCHWISMLWCQWYGTSTNHSTPDNNMQVFVAMFNMMSIVLQPYSPLWAVVRCQSRSSIGASTEFPPEFIIGFQTNM